MKLQFFLILCLSFSSAFLLKMKDGQKREQITGSNIGTNIYNILTVTQPMKRPVRKWHFNVFNLKNNLNIFRQAQYNGLRYQTELLSDNIERLKDEMQEEHLEQRELNSLQSVMASKIFQRPRMESNKEIIINTKCP